jgi:2-succinyl-5-enolpyruvyl-6-hydroxy-3-cyclohexene-1-carboxylate synthase
MSRPLQPALDFRNTNTLWGSVLVETLFQLGVTQAVISPGSRSTPLTLAFARHAGFAAIPVLDERSAGFFALGLAKAHGRPVVLVCTSGTAGANYFPAIIEAQESGVPLLVLTADRPPEMRECRSGQTIDQQKLYGSHVNFYHECAVPVASLAMLRYLRQTLAEAVVRTSQPRRGPVHLNCPFRDPLHPAAEKTPTELLTSIGSNFFAGLAEPKVATVSALGRSGLSKPFTTEPAGLIVVGAVETPKGKAFAQIVGQLSRALGWPVLADGLNPLRMHANSAGHLITHYDTILRHEGCAELLRPKRVLCLGGWPTSKILRNWLQQGDPETIMVSDRPINLDPLHLRSRALTADPTTWVHGCTGRRRLSSYAQQWLAANLQVKNYFSKYWRASTDAFEPRWVPVLARQLPLRTKIFVANSMPVRDLEYFWPATNRGHDIYFNRGANGIDGTLSTALGVASGPGSTVLITGDLALLHDTNGWLLAAKFKGSLTIVLINNNGGGIFEHLPVAQVTPHFEDFFATPQDVNFKQLCSAYGVKHLLVRDWSHLAILLASLPQTGLRVLEVCTARKADAAQRRALFQAAAQKLR